MASTPTSNWSDLTRSSSNSPLAGTAWKQQDYFAVVFERMTRRNIPSALPGVPLFASAAHRHPNPNGNGRRCDMDQTLTDTLNHILCPRAVLVLAQLTVGIGLLYVIEKFFKFVEDHLAEGTQIEIADWLRGVRTADHVPWPQTFARVFDSVFGTKHLSWKCFRRSCIASYGVAFIAFCVSSFNLRHFEVLGVFSWAIIAIFANVLPDYVSLLESRVMLNEMVKRDSALVNIAILLLDLGITCVIAGMATLTTYAMFMDFAHMAPNLSQPGGVRDVVTTMLRDLAGLNWVQMLAMFATYKTSDVNVRQSLLWWFIPAFFTSIWLWLYAGSGFLLKAARRFDKYLGWFNRLDIEKHPLSSIGLVAGALVALVYWSAVVVSRVVK